MSPIRNQLEWSSSRRNPEKRRSTQCELVVVAVGVASVFVAVTEVDEKRASWWGD
jgi:hypothetical protein